MNKVITLILVLISTQIFSQTIISGGDIAGTWNSQGNPYIIDGDLIVSADERLAIESGVTILFNGPYSIEVYGRLDASGSENDSIVFTVSDTTGFSSGSNNGWNGIAFFGPSTTTNEYSYLDYCRIEYSGLSGITCMSFDNLIVSHSTICNNTFAGISLMDFSDISIDHTVICNNGSEGIAVNSSAPLVTDFVISNNHKSGVKIMGSSNGSQIPLFSNGLISNNHTNLYGGGIYAGMDASANFEHVIVSANSAINGGGVYCSFGNLTILNSEIKSNTAQFGGGIYNNNYSSMTIKRVLLSDNSASQEGGALYVYDAETTIDYATVANNTATASTGGLFFDLMTSVPNTITNSIIHHNYPGETGAVNFGPDITYSDVDGGYEGIGNIDQDPRYVDFDSGNYELSWPWYPGDSKDRSPCIDAGDPASAQDPDGTRSDMGYKYFHQSSGIIGSSKSVAKANVYPNPAVNEFSINSDESIQGGTLLNLAGHEVKRFDALNSHTTVNIANLETGIYVLKMQTVDGRFFTEKIIKK